MKNNKSVDIDLGGIEEGLRPSLLLHCCCAPCAAGCIERFTERFDVTAFYYNPNITDIEEREKRFAELKRLMDEFGVETIDGGDGDFEGLVKGLGSEPEGGSRCALCFKMRLERTAREAKNYDYFATTLTLSPLKNARLINDIGAEAAKKEGSVYIRTDLKKRGGVLRSSELCKKYSLYRQNYCGCVYSRRKD